MSGFDDGRVSRRGFARLVIAAGSATLLPAHGFAQAVTTRPIPSTGEPLPMVGVGTASLYSRDDDTSRRAAREVIEALVAGGASLIDTASSYGDAEAVIGATLAATGLRAKTFIATKLRQPDPAELRRSLDRLKVDKIDLLQFHNVTANKLSLAQFHRWKQEGVCRYVGITSTRHADYDAVATALQHEKPDFVQVDYSVDNREAERRLLPLAADNKVAVLTALPFGRNRLFRAVHGKRLPEWAADFDATTWAQFFLKFLLGHPAVTAVIPGTAKAPHMVDNLGAARGRLPDAAQRRRMVALIESL